MSDPGSNFSWHWRQYEMLREEIMQHLHESRQLELYGVGAVAAFYAWLLTNSTSAPRWSGFIGVLIPLFGGLRGYVTGLRIDEIASYLRNLEQIAFTESTQPLGWERHFAGIGTKRLTRMSSALVWVVLLATAVLASSLLIWK
jgi:hypothetical protein